jgi:integrase
MSTLTCERVEWSLAKQQRMQEHLVDHWAEDTWDVVGQKPGRRKQYLRFPLLSSPLKTELKYAIWYKFHSGAWTLGRDQRYVCKEFNTLVAWLNIVAPHCPSLMAYSFDHWETSLRSYLVQSGKYKPVIRSHLHATQQYYQHVGEDRRICLLRNLYNVIAEAYDDREETDKEIWDMRKLGLVVNPTGTNFHLNFTSIEQPWLRALAKDFMKYHMAVRSPNDCCGKLGAIRAFSQFLTQYAPHCQLAEIDRSLILAYLHFLQVQTHKGPSRRNGLLIGLRVFLETCAHRLQIPGLTKERIIFDDDLAKEPEYVSREIPEEVLVQLRTHLNALPTNILRMTTVLLEVGMRLSELLTLPLDCLICDDRHEWYLHFSLWKSKKEQVVPLVDETVVGAIQAQQQDIRATQGSICPYLFPSPRSLLKPYKQNAFRQHLNEWSVSKNIRDRDGKIWRFTGHQFRHTVGMRLINEDVPLEVISRLLGHATVRLDSAVCPQTGGGIEERTRTRRTQTQNGGLPGTCRQRRSASQRPAGPDGAQGDTWPDPCRWRLWATGRAWGMQLRQQVPHLSHVAHLDR